MKSNTETNKFSTLEKIIFIGLLILIVVNIVNRVFSSPFDYDEGVNLILVKIIFQTGKYSSYKNDSISGVAWYNAPEISYLSDKQILRIPEDKKAIYLISHPFGRLLVPSVNARISEYPFKETVFETQLYSIYKKYE